MILGAAAEDVPAAAPLVADEDGAGGARISAVTVLETPIRASAPRTMPVAKERCWANKEQNGRESVLKYFHRFGSFSSEIRNLQVWLLSLYPLRHERYSFVVMV